MSLGKQRDSFLKTQGYREDNNMTENCKAMVKRKLLKPTELKELSHDIFSYFGHVQNYL